MTKDLDEEELWNVIKDSPLNKSPGSDGFTKFYKAFWPVIKKPLQPCYKTYLYKKEQSISQRRGIISLIPKPNKDLNKLKN